MYERIPGQLGGDSLVWHDKPRPEPPDPKLDRILLKQLLKDTGWTVETLNLAIAAYGHPKPIGRTLGGVWGKEEPIYSRSALAAWRDQKIADLSRLGFVVKAK